MVRVPFILPDCLPMTRLILAAALVALLAIPSHAESFKWVQYGAHGPEVRAVTDAFTCPVLEIDGATMPMAVRANADAVFPVTICSAPIPAGAKSISVDKLPLNPPPAVLNRIVVIGDTGCRMKGTVMQACNDPVAWPFRQVADQAAWTKPDLVIHVGDYHYRESPCPDGNRGCAGSPVGDNWPVWRADFFSPAEALLLSAPWVLVRGNHEECARAGKGWTRLLEATAYDPAEPCAATRPPFLARLPNLTLAVLDAASAGEPSVVDAQAAFYRDQFKTLASQTTGPTWLLLHRPIWGIAHVTDGKADGGNMTLDAAARDGLPSSVSLMLSGHIHTVQFISYDRNLPPQIVAGHGGDNLDREVPDRLDGLDIISAHIAHGMNMPAAFGFMTLDRTDGGWAATDYDVHGNKLRTCRIEERSISCP